MQRSLIVAVVCFLLGFGAEFALNYEPADPGDRAKLVEWARKVSGSTGSDAKGWSCSLSTSVEGDAFRLNERANDVRINVIQADGRDFGGWAFGPIPFSEASVGAAKPTWIEWVLESPPATEP